MSPGAEGRKDLLKEWRREYAKENDIPAFMVFSDRTLMDLANKNPSNTAELLRVYGFGEMKAEALGGPIFQVLGHAFVTG